MAKPFLKWAGGKTKLLPEIRARLPEDFHDLTYHEPFLGGGSVFLGLEPKSAVLSDVNLGLINVYRHVRDSAAELLRCLHAHEDWHRADPKFHYAGVRGRYNLEPKSGVSQASRFIYLNRTCFNGLYRENAKGEFNVPIGSYVSPTVCDTNTILAASAALQGVDLLHGSFDLGPPPGYGHFVYADPPYHETFTKYTKVGFYSGRQWDLAGWLNSHHNAGGLFMASNSDTPFIRELYGRFNVQVVSSSRGMDRKRVGELLITNY